MEGPGGMVEDATGPLSGWTYLRSMPWRRSAATNFLFRVVGILRLDLARCLQIWPAAARKRARLIDDVICVLVVL